MLKKALAILAFAAFFPLMHTAQAQDQTAAADAYMTADQLRDAFAGNWAIGNGWKECYSEDGEIWSVLTADEGYGTWSIREDDKSAYVHYVYRNGDMTDSRIKWVDDDTVEYHKLTGGSKGRADIEPCNRW
jgi:hypothetical protein